MEAASYRSRSSKLWLDAGLRSNSHTTRTSRTHQTSWTQICPSPPCHSHLRQQPALVEQALARTTMQLLEAVMCFQRRHQQLNLTSRAACSSPLQSATHSRSCLQLQPRLLHRCRTWQSIRRLVTLCLYHKQATIQETPCLGTMPIVLTATITTVAASLRQCPFKAILSSLSSTSSNE